MPVHGLMKQACLSIGYTQDNLYEQARLLAERLHLKVGSALPGLYVTESRLELRMPDFAPLYVDFTRQPADKAQGLIRACKPVKGSRILDATAGWGRDAACLAYAGAEVLMIERNPVISALLEDGLRRFEGKPFWYGSLTLKTMDAKTYLAQIETSNQPDMVYLDPMHPKRQKSALVKKGMQALQSLLGPDDDALALLELARAAASRKVIVKWPKRLPPLLKPNSSIPGKTVRFDVYTPI